MASSGSGAKISTVQRFPWSTKVQSSSVQAEKKTLDAPPRMQEHAPLRKEEDGAATSLGSAPRDENGTAQSPDDQEHAKRLLEKAQQLFPMFSIPGHVAGAQNSGDAGAGSASEDRIITLKGFLDLLSSAGVLRAAETLKPEITVTVKDATLAFRSVSTMVDGVSRPGHSLGGFETVLRQLEDSIPAMNQHVHIQPLSHVGGGSAHTRWDDPTEQMTNREFPLRPAHRPQPVRKTVPRKEIPVQSANEMFKQLQQRIAQANKLFTSYVTESVVIDGEGLATDRQVGHVLEFYDAIHILADTGLLRDWKNCWESDPISTVTFKEVQAAFRTMNNKNQFLRPDFQMFLRLIEKKIHMQQLNVRPKPQLLVPKLGLHAIDHGGSELNLKRVTLLSFLQSGKHPKTPRSRFFNAGTPKAPPSTARDRPPPAEMMSVPSTAHVGHRGSGSQTAREWSRFDEFMRVDDWTTKRSALPPGPPQTAQWNDITAVESLKTFEQINYERVYCEGTQLRQAVGGKLVPMSARAAYQWKRKAVFPTRGHQCMRIPLQAKRPSTRPGLKKIEALRREQAGVDGMSLATEEDRLQTSYNAVDSLHQEIHGLLNEGDGTPSGGESEEERESREMSRATSREMVSRTGLYSRASMASRQSVTVRVQRNWATALVREGLKAIFDNVYEAFVYFDHFGTNVVTRSVLKRGLELLELIPADSEPREFVELLMNEIDSVCRDGQIDCQEFTRFFKWHPLGDLEEALLVVKMKRRQIVKMADAKVRTYTGKISTHETFTLKPRTLQDVANIFGTLYNTESLFDSFASHGRKKTMVMHLNLEQMVPDSPAPNKQKNPRINMNKVMLLFQHTKLIVPGEDSIIEKRYVAKAFNRVFNEEHRDVNEEDMDASPTLTFQMFKKMLRRLAKRLGLAMPGMDDRLPDNEKDSLLIRKKVKMERIRQLTVKGTDPSFPGVIMDGYLTTEESEEYRRLNREVDKMKKRIEVLEDEEFEQQNRPLMSDEESKRQRLRLRMERRLDNDMKAVIPPPFKYFMVGITDPLNAEFTGMGGDDDREGSDSDSQADAPDPLLTQRNRRRSSVVEVLRSPIIKSPGRAVSGARAI